MMRFAVAVILIAALALAPSVAASNWCDQTLIAFAPSSVPSGRDNTFTVQVTNTGPNTITLSAVQAKFPWEGTYRDTGSGAIAAGQVGFFSTTVTAPPPGTYSVEVMITGTTSADPAGTAAVSCNTSFSLSVTQSSPALDAPAVTAGLLIAAAAVARRRL